MAAHKRHKKKQTSSPQATQPYRAIVPPLDGYIVEEYVDKNGKNHFREWLEGLKDLRAKAKIDRRISLARQGSLGDFKKLIGAEGLYEFRIDYGPGYRVYCAKEGNTLIILLGGGDKTTQTVDIKNAGVNLDEHRKPKP